MQDKKINSKDLIDSVSDIGFELSNNEAEQYREQIEGYLATFDQLQTEGETKKTVATLQDGTDSYNAFLYRFDLGSESGPLNGLEIGIKDNFAIAGVPMTCGSDTFYFEPEYTATVVERICSNGGKVIGTTNMDEFAFGTTGDLCAHGAVKNPRAPGYTTGGSTSGGAAAVASGLADAAIGSDTGGSVRIPAALCGVIGLKPTYRTISRFGLVDLAPSHDHVGILSESTDHIWKLFQAVQGPDVRDPSTIGTQTLSKNAATGFSESDSEYKIGLIQEMFNESVTDVSTTVLNALDQLSQQGVEREWISFDSIEEIRIAGSCIVLHEFSQFVANNGLLYGPSTEYTEQLRSALEAANKNGAFQNRAGEQLLKGKPILDQCDGSHYIAAQNKRQQTTQSINQYFKTFDALISPTVQIPAPKPGEIEMTDSVPRPLANTMPFNMSGHPAVTVPCGTVEGKPVGVQIVTPWHEEAKALTLAQSIKDILNN